MKKLLFISFFISFSVLNVKGQEYPIKVATTCHLYYTQKDIDDFIQNKILYAIKHKKYTSSINFRSINEFIVYPVTTYEYVGKFFEKDIENKILCQNLKIIDNAVEAYICNSNKIPIGYIDNYLPYIYETYGYFKNIQHIIEKWNICMLFKTSNLNRLWGMTESGETYIFADKEDLLYKNSRFNRQDTIITPERFVELYKDEIHYYDEDK